MRDVVNYRMPATDISEVIAAGKSQLPLKFQKLRLDQDWGENLAQSFCVMIDELNGEKFKRHEMDYNHIREQKLPLIQAAELER